MGYCKGKSRQTFRFAPYKAATDTVLFILDRTDPEKTPLTVEISGKQVYHFDSLEGVGMPKGTALCPYAYIQYNDKISLLHTKKSRRPFAVGDSQLTNILKTCTRLRPDTLMSEEKGDEFCEAIVQHHSEVTSLNFRGCKDITDDGLQKLIDGCTALDTIDVTECTGLTEKGLEAIAAVCNNVVNEPPEEKSEETKKQPLKQKSFRKADKKELFDSSCSSDQDW